MDNLRAKCKSVNFPGTFKLVRYLVMPEKAHDFFMSDRYLGEPLIQKIMKDELIPDTWYDPNDWEEHAFPFRHYNYNGPKSEEYKKIIDRISPGTFFEDTFPRFHRAWQSFHLYQDYPLITKVGQESLVIALARFDQFLERSDSKKF
ncbi:hypothetical protein J4456_02300 [Candidatus Pacearchaeota archaeon]|nr:hypothetical protein [Candidatus Pacearchaeota archaeon]